MKAIVNAFEWIISFLKLIYETISNIFNGLIQGFRLIGKAIQLMTSAITTMPVWLSGIFTIAISIMIIYFIINRQTGGK